MEVVVEETSRRSCFSDCEDLAGDDDQRIYAWRDKGASAPEAWDCSRCQNLFMSGSIFPVRNLMSFRMLREFSHLMTVLDGFGFAHMEGLQEALGFSSHQDPGSQSPCLAGP